jgi:hypothetical protein
MLIFSNVPSLDTTEVDRQELKTTLSVIHSHVQVLMKEQSQNIDQWRQGDPPGSFPFT